MPVFRKARSLSELAVKTTRTGLQSYLNCFHLVSNFRNWFWGSLASIGVLFESNSKVNVLLNNAARISHRSFYIIKEKSSEEQEKPSKQKKLKSRYETKEKEI